MHFLKIKSRLEQGRFFYLYPFDGILERFEVFYKCKSPVKTNEAFVPGAGIEPARPSLATGF